MAESSATANVPDPISTQEVQSEESIHELFQIPTRPLTVTFRVFFGLACIVTGMTQVTIKQLLLPNQVYLFFPHDLGGRNIAFTIVASIGALVGVLAAPISGAISDRTTLRWGRRRPWLVFGILFGLVGLFLMAQATTVVQLLIGEIIVQVSFDTILSTTTAIIPDQVPLNQRALAAAFVGMSPIVGGLVGLLLVTRFTNATTNPQTGYYVLGAASFILVIAFLLVLREKPLPRGVMPPFQLKSFLTGFLINPKKYPDFGYTWLSRCLIFLGYTILISYIVFYLRDVIHYQRADQGVVIFQLIATGTLILAAVIGGIVSDRMQRLKPFVCGGAVVMTIALLLIAFIPGWPIMLAAAVLLGIGFGVYLAVDIALAVKVLPTATNRGKDLGIINTAIFLPLILSPIIGTVILNTVQSYTVLFAIAALCFLLAALLVLPIKSVR